MTGVPPAAAHVFLDGLAPGVLEDADLLPLAADDAHHLVRVLRLRDGQDVTVADGAGAWRLCRLRLAPGRDPALEPSGPIVVEAPPEPRLVIAMALPKGERGDWAVQKLTEIGVDVIVPLLASRSVVRRVGQRADRGRDRLERVCRAAAMQSRRARLPLVAEPADPAAVVADAGGGACAAEPGGRALRLDRPTVLVGPEGGWAPGELPDDLPRVGLGPTTLRTETAAVVAAGALALMRAGLLEPSRGSRD